MPFWVPGIFRGVAGKLRLAPIKTSSGVVIGGIGLKRGCVLEGLLRLERSSALRSWPPSSFDGRISAGDFDGGERIYVSSNTTVSKIWGYDGLGILAISCDARPRCVSISCQNLLSISR